MTSDWESPLNESGTAMNGLKLRSSQGTLNLEGGHTSSSLVF